MRRAIAALVAASALSACVAPSPRAQLGDAARGERAFLKCFSCHATEAGGQPLSGPHLADIIDRRIASIEGFSYSPAMRSFAAREQRWSVELLDRFIADPEALVPGTEMGFFGISDAGERAELIAYLRRGATR